MIYWSTVPRKLSNWEATRPMAMMPAKTYGTRGAISNIDDKLCQHFTPLFNFDVRDPVQIVRQTTQLPQTPLDLKDIRVAVLAIGLLVSFPQMIQFRIGDRHVGDKVDHLTSFHFLVGSVHTVDSTSYLFCGELMDFFIFPLSS